MSNFVLGQDSWIWNRSTIDVHYFSLRLFQSFFGLERVHSDLLIHHADLACLRPCKLHTKGLSERRTSPCSALALLLQKNESKYRNCVHHFFIQRIYWILWEIWHKSKPSECSLCVNNVVWFLTEWRSRRITLQFNNEWMQLLFGWDIIACTNLPMFCFRLFYSCCYVEDLGIWHRLRVLSSLCLQHVSPCSRVELAKHFGEWLWWQSWR